MQVGFWVWFGGGWSELCACQLYPWETEPRYLFSWTYGEPHSWSQLCGSKDSHSVQMKTNYQRQQLLYVQDFLDLCQSRGISFQ